MSREDPAEWLEAFVRRYRRQFDPHDWPTDPDELVEFLRGWLAAFKKHSVEQGEAEAARVRLGEYPPKFRNDHLPALIAVVKSMRTPESITSTEAARKQRQREIDVRFRKEQDLTERWNRLDEETRKRIREEVEFENPGCVKFEPFMRRLCLARVQDIKGDVT